MPVQIVNETPLAVGFTAGRVRKTGFHLTTIVKGSFKLVHGGSAVAADKPLLTGDAHFEDEAGATCTYASDFAPFKPRTDVTALGTCHLPRSVSQGVARVALRVGAMRKALAVYSDRYFVEQKLGGWDISEPKPFRSFPLRYESAFGGAGYAANPVGKGYGALSSSASRALPNIESPSRLLKTPTDRTDPAGFAPLNRRWGLRSSKMGTYDPAWLQERWPDFPVDFDWSYFNAAPEDQQVDYLSGDEPIVVEGMHPEIERYETRLPAVRPRCFLRRVGATDALPEEIALQLDTVALDMDAETVVLVWRGLTEVWSREYAEVEGALLVAESMYDAAQPASVYHADAYWRPAAPPVADLADADEAAARAGVPAQAPPPPAAPTDRDDAERAEVDEARAELVKAGADKALIERTEGVTRLAVLAAIMTAYMEEQLPESARAELASRDASARAEASAGPSAGPAPHPSREARRKEKAERDKAELDEMRAELAKKNADPKLLERLAPVTKLAVFLDILLGELPVTAGHDDAKERKELVAGVAAAEARAEEADLAGEAAVRKKRGERLTRDEVVAMIAVKESLAEANLTGLDLSGLDLSKMNLTSAVLVGARLEATIFAGADLTSATLRLADLRSAVLDDALAAGADLEGAKLGGAKASRAVFSRARMSNATLEGAELEGADFTGANLAHANLSKARMVGALFDGANLEQASLRGAKGQKAKFRGARLVSADLTGAELDGATFIGANLDGAEASRASLKQAHFEESSGKGASFPQASLTGLRAQDASFPKARFTKVSAEGARFAGSDLTDADFGGAHLVESDFSEAIMNGASFHLARLEQANLTKAKLAGARLTQVNLFRGRLGGADLTDADCRSSNLFECELFEANATRTNFDRTNLKRTCLDRGAK